VMIPLGGSCDVVIEVVPLSFFNQHRQRSVG
jgi:hypothetical protein